MSGRPIPARRGIFTNRTLNMRSIKAIGYDMDYTLIHYNHALWEARAYAYVRDALERDGWPVKGLEFDPELVILGLIIDRQLGNVVKANRFGYIKRAAHGTRLLDHDEKRVAYAREIVDLKEDRWVFMNTLFSLSEACLYSQLVDLFDRGELKGVQGYWDLYGRVRRAIDYAHAEGRLKAEIIANPERFVDLDEEMPLTLLDQKNAGKRLVLITNSEWPYTRAMMTWAVDPLLPKGMGWRDLFDLRVCSARKPAFFELENPAFEVVDEEGLLRPVVGPLELGKTYVGGDAAKVERMLGLSGAQILYVGDHIYADVHVTKSVLRWRTALVVRELESDLVHQERFGENSQRQLSALMDQKETLEYEQAELRLQMQRLVQGYGPQPEASRREIEAALDDVRERLMALDETISPLAKLASELSNPRWGLLMRAGRDKSHLARQLERHADIYTSRVSNMLLHTPYLYLRSPRSSLPHDDLR